MLLWQPDHTTTAAGYCTGVGKDVLSHQFNLNSETFANIINQSRTHAPPNEKWSGDPFLGQTTKMW